MTSDCLISGDRKLSAALGKFHFLSPAQVLSVFTVATNFDDFPFNFKNGVNHDFYIK